MTEQPVSFLQDDHGNASSMRLMCLLSLVAAMGVAVLAILRPTPTGNEVYIFYGFLLGAFAPKALQKHIETRSGRP